MLKNTTGKIIKPYGAQISQHELAAAKTLISATGKSITFLPPRSIKTPDIVFLDKEWEIKTPSGKGSRTIEDCLRRGSSQSPNLIIDIRFTKISETQCLRCIQRQVSQVAAIKNVLVIARPNRIIDKFCNFEIIKG